MADLGPSFFEELVEPSQSLQPLPPGWEAYVFVWVGPKGQYFYHPESSLVTTYDVRLLEHDHRMSAVFNARIAYAKSVKGNYSHLEVIFSPPSDVTVADSTPSLLGVVDHSQLTIVFDFCPSDFTPDAAYAQYVQYTNWSHLEKYGIIVVCATVPDFTLVFSAVCSTRC
jgi:hypothetical protein